MTITIIGGGLAGCEAAWQAAGQGIPVRLLEIKPLRFSQARLMWVEVPTAEGKTFSQESFHIMGSYCPLEYRLTDEMLKAKFRDNA